MGRFFIGITGASGHAYSTSLVRELVRAGHDVDLSITDAGAKVMAHELGIDPGPGGQGLADCLNEWLGEEIACAVRAFPSAAIESPAASGTALTEAVILAPCSMGTLARVTHGFSSNLVERAADVALKEGRTLLVMPRETPLSEVHLSNMLQLARMGAAILPCTPGFYQHPKSLEDLVQFVVAKALDRLGVQHALGARWGASDPDEETGIKAPGGSH
jgi:4-hydroxy-3-polyprenylbenzoate decarboxylase